jgi:hypothetical protein
MGKKPLQADVFLCLGINGIHTPMEHIKCVLLKTKENRIYLKELGGKREFAYNNQLVFKASSKNNTTDLLCFYDRDSLLQINPKEIMSGEEFNRTDIKNAISGQISAERRLKARIGAEQMNKVYIGIAVIFLLTGIIMLATMLIFINGITHPVIQVQIVNSSYSAQGANIGQAVANTIGALNKIP